MAIKFEGVRKKSIIVTPVEGLFLARKPENKAVINHLGWRALVGVSNPRHLRKFEDWNLQYLNTYIETDPEIKQKLHIHSPNAYLHTIAGSAKRSIRIGNVLWQLNFPNPGSLEDEPEGDN
jgi:hypothetical protein